MFTPTILVFPEAQRRRARIEIIPLIDVVFFLLATFVLFTLSRERIVQHDIVFPIPSPVPDRASLDDQTLYLTSSGDDYYLWKIGRDSVAEALHAAELRPFLAQYKRTVARPRVLLNGDGTAKFSSSIRALDAVKLAKIREYSFDTSGY